MKKIGVIFLLLLLTAFFTGCNQTITGIDAHNNKSSTELTENSSLSATQEWRDNFESLFQENETQTISDQTKTNDSQTIQNVSQKKEVTVYITKTGSKYHKEG